MLQGKLATNHKRKKSHDLKPQLETNSEFLQDAKPYIIYCIFKKKRYNEHMCNKHALDAESHLTRKFKKKTPSITPSLHTTKAQTSIPSTSISFCQTPHLCTQWSFRINTMTTDITSHTFGAKRLLPGSGCGKKETYR